MAFSSFSFAVLLQHDRTRSIFMIPVTFMIEKTWKRRLKMADNTCMIFSHPNLSAFMQKKQKINEWRETLQNLKEIFYVNFVFIKILEKMQQIFDCDRRPARL